MAGEYEKAVVRAKRENINESGGYQSKRHNDRKAFWKKESKLFSKEQERETNKKGEKIVEKKHYLIVMTCWPKKRWLSRRILQKLKMKKNFLLIIKALETNKIKIHWWHNQSITIDEK